METVAFDNAVRVAKDLTKEEDTLLIVTADHSHVFTIAGYSKRGNDILGNFIFFLHSFILAFMLSLDSIKDNSVGSAMELAGEEVC